MGSAQVKWLGWNLQQFLLLLRRALLPSLKQESCRGNFDEDIMVRKIQPLRLLKADKGPVPAPGLSGPSLEFRVLQ